MYNKQLLLELYETKYEICNHINTINPLALVQLNPSEDYFTDTLYENYLRNFLYRDIGKKLNMSFDDFINRPRYEIVTILKIINEIDKKKIKMNENMLSDLEKSSTKLDTDD